MAIKTPSTGAIVGFSLLAGAVLIFTLGVAIYAVYLHYCRKDKKKASPDPDVILRSKHHQNGIESHSRPTSSARESKASSAKRQSHISANSNRASSKHESTRSSTVVETTAVVVAVETESRQSVRTSGWDNPLVELDNVIDEEDKRIEEASQLGSDIHTADSGFQNGGTLERQQPEILEEEPDYKRNSAIYAHVDDVTVPTTSSSSTAYVTVIETPPSPTPPSPEPSLPSDTLERKEAKDLGRSNSILNRVQYFESSNSLVRPAKRDKELEGVRSNVVKALKTDFENSDKVILGRAAPEPGDAQFIPKPSQSQQLNNHTDPDNGEPLYAVPDRSRKSLTRKPRPDSQISDHSDKLTPQVPTKPDDI